MEKITEKLMELFEVLKSEMSDTTTSVRIIATAQGITIESTIKTPDQLRTEGVSMRNIKGEWIVEKKVKEIFPGTLTQLNAL